jgi:hypothetical protein
MPTLVTIGGVSVDADDPCALYRALYAQKLKMLAGERIEETEIRSSVSQRRIKLSAACTAKTGGGKRSRFAKSIRFC